MKKLLLFIFVPFLAFGQTQIGDDIDGEAEFDQSGYSVSTSGDGSIIAIGAPSNDGNGISSGHVRVYENIAGDWVQLGDDIDGEYRSGYSVSLSSNGNIVAIGAPYNDEIGPVNGRVRVYENIAGDWVQLGDEINGEAVDDYFGWSVSMSSDGNIVAIGAPYNDGNGLSSGQVRVYEIINGDWVQVGEVIESEAEFDQSGWSVSLSNNGSIIAIGAINNTGNGISKGHVRIYENISGFWTQIGDDIDGEADNDGSGNSVSLSSNGTIIAIGAKWNDGNGVNSGHVRIFKNIDDVWTQIGDDIDGEAAGDSSGINLSLSNNGKIIAIGAQRNDANGNFSGHVRVYQNVDNVWVQVGIDIDGVTENNFFGVGISLSNNGSIAVIGAPGNSDNGQRSGKVQVYDLSQILSSNTTISEENITLYPNPATNTITIKLSENNVINTITIFNSLGQIVHTATNPIIDISALSAGSYYVEVATNRGGITKQLTVK